MLCHWRPTKELSTSVDVIVCAYVSQTEPNCQSIAVSGIASQSNKAQDFSIFERGLPNFALLIIYTICKLVLDMLPFKSTSMLHLAAIDKSRPLLGQAGSCSGSMTEAKKHFSMLCHIPFRQLKLKIGKPKLKYAEVGPIHQMYPASKG